MSEKRKVVIAAAAWHQDEVKMLEEAGAAVKVIPDKADDLFLSEVKSADGVIVGLPANAPGTFGRFPQFGHRRPPRRGI